MGKGIILVLIGMVIIMGAANAADEKMNTSYKMMVAYLQNGKIMVSDCEGNERKVLLELKDEKIIEFGVSRNRVIRVAITEKGNVYYRTDDGQVSKIFTAQDIAEILLLDDNGIDLLVSGANGKVIESLEMSYPIYDYYLVSAANTRKTTLPGDKRMMLAGHYLVAAFESSGLLEKSFKLFNLITGKCQKVGIPEKEAYFPSISPDGKFLAYYYKNPADGGLGIRVYDLETRKLVADQSPVYNYPAGNILEPPVWSEGRLLVHVCFYVNGKARNSFIRIDPRDANFLHESQYLTQGQFDFLVEDAVGEDVLFLYRENENREYILYLVPATGCSEDKIKIASGVKNAKFITLK